MCKHQAHSVKLDCFNQCASVSFSHHRLFFIQSIQTYSIAYYYHNLLLRDTSITTIYLLEFAFTNVQGSLQHSEPTQHAFNSNMMRSSNGNGFRVTGFLCGEFTGDALLVFCAGNSLMTRYWPFVRGIHRSCGALMFSLICAWLNSWVHNRAAGDLRRHSAHYDVIVMKHPSVRAYLSGGPTNL